MKPAAPSPAAHLLLGRTVHQRELPFRRAFSYAVAMIQIDIDRLDEASGQSLLLGVDRFALFSFHRADHGARDGSGLRQWAQDQMREAGIRTHAARIDLATFPRVLGFGFAPISVWTCRDGAGDLICAIYEVHNTFGEAHAYVAPAFSANSHGRQVEYSDAPKSFHVSPFQDVSGRYDFTLEAGCDKLRLVVENIAEGQRGHIASLVARKSELTTGALLRVFASMPFSAIGVVAAIHWQALKIWMRGARYRRRPPLPERAATIASGPQSRARDDNAAMIPGERMEDAA